MLGTLPLQAAYLQQLLHICQASSRSPLTHSKTDPQRLTYSNANIEAINSALAAQWSNPTYHRSVPTAAFTAAACAAAPSCEQMPAGNFAAAEAASQQSVHDRSGVAAQQRMADELERSASGISQQSRNTSLCSGYDRRLHSMPMTPHGLMQSASHQGLTHTSQGQSGQGFTQLHGQGGMQCGRLQSLREAEAAAIRQTMEAPQSLTPFLWGCSAASQGQGIAEQAHSSQSSSEAWTGQGIAEQGQSGHQGWAGQGSGRSQDDPLNAAEYEAVMRLQSLALQLQTTGNKSAGTLLIFLCIFAHILASASNMLLFFENMLLISGYLRALCCG